MSFSAQVPISAYIAAARSPPLSEPANKKFFRQCTYVHCRNNAQLQIMRSLSLPNDAMRVAGPVADDYRSDELRIITTTPGTAECGLAVGIDDSSPEAVECGSVLAPSLSDQLPYSRVLSTGFRVQATMR